MLKEKEPIIILVSEIPSHKVFIRKTLSTSHLLLEAKSSLEALDKIRSNEISIIIVDDNIGKESIQIFCQNIRQNPQGKFIPILVISNNLKKSYIQEIITSGATDFLREPLNEEELQKVISSSLYAKRTEQKLGPILHKIQTPQQSQRSLGEMKFSQRDQAISEIDKALKHQHSLSLLLIDIDHHVKIKEKWGELTLEEVSDQVELFLKQHLRPQDILTRATDEKFIVILPKTSETAAEIISEELKESLKDHSFKLSKGTLKVSISIGLTSLSKNENQGSSAYNYLETMLRRGEESLSKAKKLGNRLVTGDHQ